MVSKEEKSMGVWSGTSLGVGAMVGAGIFSIFGAAVAISGKGLIISFMIAGVIALLSSYSYAKMGAKYPTKGGPTEFILRGIGDNLLTGSLNILLWFSYIFALALYAKGFALYFITFFSNSSAIFVDIVASSIIIAFTLLGLLGAKAVGKSEIFIVITKVIILFLFAVIGSFFVKSVNLAGTVVFNFSNVFFGAAFVFLAYQGFGLVTNAAGDMKNPKKDLPKAIYLSIGIVIIIYIFVSFVVIGNLDLAQILKAKNYALAQAAKPFLGILGFKIMALAALFSTASAINASLFGGANVSYMIAKRGELPKLFDRKIWHSKATEGLFITSFIVLLFVNGLSLEGIGFIGSASLMLIYLAVHYSHFKLRKKTKSNSFLIISAFLSIIVFLVMLIYSQIKHNFGSVIILFLVLSVSFGTEFVYRKITKRELKFHKIIE